jgi:hypothetical protein
MSARTLSAAALIVLSSAGAGAVAQWYVVFGPDRSCMVSDGLFFDSGKLAGPYATEAEAMARKDELAVCEYVNTDPDPDD